MTTLTSRTALFWDINSKDIARTLVECDEWVLVRVFEHGTIDDIFEVISLYGKEKAKQILAKATMNRVGQSMTRLFLDIEDNRDAS